MGEPVGFTGMTWSGFRPSDDACRYGYLVPSNLFAARALRSAKLRHAQGRRRNAQRRNGRSARLRGLCLNASKRERRCSASKGTRDMEKKLQTGTAPRKKCEVKMPVRATMPKAPVRATLTKLKLKAPVRPVKSTAKVGQLKAPVRSPAQNAQVPKLPTRPAPVRFLQLKMPVRPAKSFVADIQPLQIAEVAKANIPQRRQPAHFVQVEMQPQQGAQNVQPLQIAEVESSAQAHCVRCNTHRGAA